VQESHVDAGRALSGAGSTARSSLEAASGTWMLVLDADEELLAPPPDLAAWLVSAPEDGYLVRVRNLQPPGSLVSYDEQRLVRSSTRSPGAARRRRRTCASRCT
jgi:hypothetical protein